MLNLFSYLWSEVMVCVYFQKKKTMYYYSSCHDITTTVIPTFQGTVPKRFQRLNIDKAAK